MSKLLEELLFGEAEVFAHGDRLVMDAVSGFDGTYTTTSATKERTLTLKDLEDSMAQIVAMKIEPEPIGEWMRSKGFPPENSLLVLPPEFFGKGPMFWPRYVRFSAHVVQPTLMKDLLGGTQYGP